MWNKLFISTLLLYVFVAGFQQYDQYITEKGEVPVVSQFLDYVGIMQFEDPLEKNQTVTKTDSFNLQLENPQLVQARINRLNNQRMQVLTERREFLTQIAELNVDILNEAIVYARLIISEGSDFLLHSSEFEQLGKDIVAAKRMTDSAEQKLEFERIQREIWNTTSSAVDNPDIDIPRLKEFYVSIQNILNEIPDVLVENCASITIEACIENSNDVQSDLKEMIETIASGPTSQTTDPFVDLLFEEYNVIASKYDSGERSLSANSTIIETEFKRLVMDLHKNFDEGVAVMRSIQKELYADQALVLAYNRDFQKRIRNTRRDRQNNQMRISPPERQDIDLFKNRNKDLSKNRYQANVRQKIGFKSDIITRSIRPPSQMSRSLSDDWKYQQKERNRVLKQRIRDLKSRQKDSRRF